MAKAEKVPAEFNVVLTLSQQEAEFLGDLIGFGIMGTGTRREIANDIYKAFESLGFARTTPKDFEGCVKLGKRP